MGCLGNTCIASMDALVRTGTVWRTPSLTSGGDLRFPLKPLWTWSRKLECGNGLSLGHKLSDTEYNRLKINGSKPSLGAPAHPTSAVCTRDIWLQKACQAQAGILQAELSEQGPLSIYLPHRQLAQEPELGFVSAMSTFTAWCRNPAVCVGLDRR